jgi:hypothetical protein
MEYRAYRSRHKCHIMSSKLWTVCGKVPLFRCINVCKRRPLTVQKQPVILGNSLASPGMLWKVQDLPENMGESPNAQTIHSST